MRKYSDLLSSELARHEVVDKWLASLSAQDQQVAMTFRQPIATAAKQCGLTKSRVRLARDRLASQAAAALFGIRGDEWRDG